MTAHESARGRDWVEIVATVVLSLAAVATAWSSYQATRWNGEQSKTAGQTNAVRIEAARADGLARSQTQIDIATFIQWVDARASADDELEAFYRSRFRPEFEPAFEAWLATTPFVDPAAPPTPFAMDDYQLAAAQDARRLDGDAEVLAATVRANVQRAGNYILAVVLFAVALFFAGMSTKLRGTGTRAVMVGVGCTLFVGAAVWVATFPISISV